MDESAGGIGAAALAHVLIDVDPAIVKALLQDLPIVLAHGRQGLVDGLLGLFKGDLDVRAGDQGRIEVVEVQFLHTKKLFPQTDVAVHFVKVLVYRLDQIVIDLHGNIGVVQRGFQGGAVFSGVRVELQGLDLGIQGRGYRVLVGGPGVIGVSEGGLAELPVIRLHVGDIGALGQGVLDAVLVHGVGESQIGVGKLGIDIIGRLHHLPGHGQQLFLIGAQHMGGMPSDIEQIAAIALQAGLLGVEAFHIGVGDRHDLRCGKGGGGGVAHVGGHGHAVHFLILGDPGVLVISAGGVIPDVAQKDLRGLGLLREGQQRPGVLTQLSGKARQLFGQKLQLIQVLLPGLVGGIQVLHSPAVLFRDLTAF